MDVAQLVQSIREQIAQRTEQPPGPGAQTEGEKPLPAPAQLAANLQSLGDEIDTLKSLSEIGEPRPPSLTLRRRLGSLLKSRLHRFLWWQSYQIKALMAIVAQQNRFAVESIRLIQDSEARLLARKDALGELQQHVARLEFCKANRTELAALATQYDSLLAAKADSWELADLKGQLATLTGRAEEHERRLDSFAEQLNVLRTAKAEQEDLKAIEERVKQGESSRNAIEERVKQGELSRVEPAQVASLANEVLTAQRKISVQRLDLQDFHRRLDVFLEQAKKRLPEPFTAKQIREMVVKGQDALDSLYVAFEDRFRGSFDEVREGIKVYVPYVREALKRTRGASVLDVACGRGEWLDLLRDEGIPARGVDLNSAAIELCQQRALQVTQEEAFTYLRKQPKNSLSAITSFHFIEHIDYRMWIALLDEALRLLKPGGVAIFETPNARNILTTAGDFYRDPTHNRPVFPETIEAIAEMRGFFDSKAYCFNEDRSELIPLTEYRFDGLQDYVSVSRDAVWVGIKSA